MVEFALVTPLLLLLLAGVLDYAWPCGPPIAVSDAARAGAHYGSLSTGQRERISRECKQPREMPPRI